MSIMYQMIGRGLYKVGNNAILYTVKSPYYGAGQEDEIYKELMDQLNSHKGELLIYDFEVCDDSDWGDNIEDTRNSYLRNINSASRSLNQELVSFLLWKGLNLFELG